MQLAGDRMVWLLPERPWLSRMGQLKGVPGSTHSHESFLLPSDRYPDPGPRGEGRDWEKCDWEHHPRAFRVRLSAPSTAGNQDVAEKHEEVG